MSLEKTMQARVDINTISSLVKNAKYAVRGPIVAKMQELNDRLNSGEKLPFTKTIPCNIGNPHSLGQKPLSFSRDVLSLVMNPSLKDRVQFAPDVVAKAERYLAGIPGMGAYSESQGILSVREDISKFLEQRDGYRSDPKDIFLTNGASEGVRVCMQTFLRDSQSGFKDGILAPIPQYPLYSALNTLLAGTLEPYYLDESQSWACTRADLEKSLAQANKNGTTVRGLVVINPGNPTGQVLEESNMRDIVQFCADQNICLFADEVYQENIWKEGAKFVSFRKVALDMGFSSVPSASNKGLQMISFHSISKVSIPCSK
jgi:aspartate/methionine/tyrosine aminotransferase